jgi:hypothetical protein
VEGVAGLGLEDGRLDLSQALDGLSVCADKDGLTGAGIDGASSFRVVGARLSGAGLVTAARLDLAQHRRLLRAEDQVRAAAGALLVTVKVVGVASASAEREFLAQLSLRIISPAREIRPAHARLLGQFTHVHY